MKYTLYALLATLFVNNALLCMNSPLSPSLKFDGKDTEFNNKASRRKNYQKKQIAKAKQNQKQTFPALNLSSALLLTRQKSSPKLKITQE